MGIMKKNILFIFAIIAVPVVSQATWRGPEVKITGSWGDSIGRFGMEVWDTGYELPDLAAVIPGDIILVHDTINGKMMVFRQTGELIKEVYKETIIDEKGHKIKRLPEYGISNIKRFDENENIWLGVGKGARHLTPTGQLLATYDQKPLELGIKSTRRRAESDNRYDTTIQYEDMTYHMILDGDWDNFVRDQNDYLYFFNSYTAKDPVSGEGSTTSLVVKYDSCGKKIGRLDLPISEYEKPTRAELDMPTTTLRVRNEYGPPVIGPDGSIYAWKRTPDTYSILKWTWVDSPDDPQPGPDVPENLKVTSSTSGLYLTWTASPQDPGCVDGYEVERATSAGGIYSNVTTVDPGVLKYNDTSALPGTTYIYKIRAKSTCGPSPYTAEISGKRIQ